MDRAAQAAHAGFLEWRRVPPLSRAAIVREASAVLRKHNRELALIDAMDCGSPVRELIRDIEMGAASMDYFAGLATEIKGVVLPSAEGQLNYTLRQPLGVIARIGAFNHPFMFAATKLAAPLVAGNAVIIKSPEQAPLSSLRLAELLGPLFPPGVLNILSGGAECGEAIVRHPLIDKIGLIGSVHTGRAILRGAAARMKKVSLELGGKNALIALPDSDPGKVGAAIIRGMNFAWCGQSCGSTSRAFVHNSIHDEVVHIVKQAAEKIRAGIPTDSQTEMGALISREHHAKVVDFIKSGCVEGATLVTGGGAPTDPQLARGFFLNPTVFSDVRHSMRIATEEIFGPVLSILRWNDEAEMLRQVEDVDYGLTAAIWTSDLATAHRLASEVRAGFVWINNVAQHFLGAPFGGLKQSGLGREESIDELLECTEIKSVNTVLMP